MDGTMRAALDASIEDALQARILSKKRHGALIKAARLCADIIDISDDPNASMMSTMLKYIKELGLSPDAVPKQPREKAPATKMDDMRARFHAVS